MVSEANLQGRGLQRGWQFGNFESLTNFFLFQLEWLCCCRFVDLTALEVVRESRNRANWWAVVRLKGETTRDNSGHSFRIHRAYRCDFVALMLPLGIIRQSHVQFRLRYRLIVESSVGKCQGRKSKNGMPSSDLQPCMSMLIACWDVLNDHGLVNWHLFMLRQSRWEWNRDKNPSPTPPPQKPSTEQMIQTSPNDTSFITRVSSIKNSMT